MAKLTPKKRIKSNAGEWHDVFLTTFRNTGNVCQSCKEAGISRETAYKWKRQDKEFAKQWEHALEDAIDMLEAIAAERARKSSDTLLIFLLKAHRPGKYRERFEHTGPEGKPTQVQIYLPENYRDRTKPPV